MTPLHTFQDRPEGPSFATRVGTVWEKGNVNLVPADLGCACVVDDVSIAHSGGGSFADRTGGPSFADRTGTTWTKASACCAFVAILAAMSGPRTAHLLPGRATGPIRKRRTSHG